MTKKIFHSILLVAGTVLLASLLVIMGCLYDYFRERAGKQLRDELDACRRPPWSRTATDYLATALLRAATA